MLFLSSTLSKRVEPYVVGGAGELLFLSSTLSKRVEPYAVGGAGELLFLSSTLSKRAEPAESEKVLQLSSERNRQRVRKFFSFRANGRKKKTGTKYRPSFNFNAT